MPVEPTWFGPRRTPLAGWLHTPPAGVAVRGCVVACPSLGQEAYDSSFALREAGERLSEHGFVVLRFDYLGTGDSTEPLDPDDQLRGWFDSIEQATAFARGHAGNSPVVLLGHRLGALLAVTDAREQTGIDGLILWDPPCSGRAYLREQRLRYGVGLGDDDDGALQGLIGLHLQPSAKQALAGLALGLDDVPSTHTLVLRRDGASTSGRTVPDDASGLTTVEVDDIESILTTKSSPVMSLERIVEWATATYPEPAAGIPQQRVTAAITVPIVPIDGDDDGVSECFVTLGSHRLFGVVTEPAVVSSDVTVICLTNHFSPHTGISRMWVELTRRCAAHGIRGLRFDQSGVGESPPAPGNKQHTLYPLAHLTDTVVAARDISPRDPSDVVLVGLCSGGYQSLEAALTLSPRAVCLVNPAFSFLTDENPASQRRRARQATRPIFAAPLGRPAGRVARRWSKINVENESFDWSRWLESSYWVVQFARFSRRVPEALRWLIIRTFTTQRPVDVFRRLVRSGTQVLLVVGDDDASLLSQGSSRAMRRLSKDPGFRVVRIPGLDHAALKEGLSEPVVAELTAYLASEFGSGTQRLGVDTSASAEASDSRVAQSVTIEALTSR